MAVLLKKLRQAMVRAPGDGNTPMPRKRNFFQLRPIVGGLRGLKTIVLPRNGQVLFMATVKGETSNYLVKIKFNDVDIQGSTEEFPGSIEAKTLNGEKIWIKKPNINRDKVDISCQCPDFRFSFEKQLFDGKSLLDKTVENGPQVANKARSFTKYVRQTPPKRRPQNPSNPNPIGADFKNPDNVAGYCKHVHSLAVFLSKLDKVDGAF